MATMHQLVDLTKSTWASVPIIRGTDAAVRIEDTRIEHAPGTLAGVSAVDSVAKTIRCDLNAQDPLVLPTVLAVSNLIGTLIVGGRNVNAATYEDYTLLRMALTGWAMRLVDQQPGSLTLNFQNRANEGSALDDEYSVASGTKQAWTNRKNTIRLRADAQFTDDLAAVMDLPGIESVSVTAQGQVVVGCSNPADGFNDNLCDVVDVTGWRYTGSIVLRDRTIATALDLPARLAAMARGDLYLPCMLSGLQTDATPPADKNVTLKRVKFHSPSSRFQSRQTASGELPFDMVVLATDQSTELTPAQMVTMADAT